MTTNTNNKLTDEQRWCPDVDPITRYPLFMWINHPELGYVPTYGGPYDSYTLTERDENGEFYRHRYDHDRGGWVEDEYVGLIVVEDWLPKDQVELNEYVQDNPTAELQERRKADNQEPASERERIRREHAEWSDATFGEVGPIGPLKHLSKEALEAAAEPDDLSEWADMQFLLWDAQRRAGVTDEQITMAMVEKLAINKARQWPEPKDGEPRLHIKEQSVPVVPEKLPCSVELKPGLIIGKGCKTETLLTALRRRTDYCAKIDAFTPEERAEHDASIEAFKVMLPTSADSQDRLRAPVVPEEMPKGLAGQIVSLLAHNIGDKFLAQKIWNACRAALLQDGFRDLSQPVDPQIAKYEQIMLQAGWVMVPVEPTDEMIAAAMNCDDVVFDSTDPTAFCVQFREIYCAMVDVAPKPELTSE